MQLRYRFRIDPTPGQRVALARAFGCARAVYNDGLRLCLEADAAGQKIPSTAALSRLVVTEAKRKPERAWLGEVSAVVLQQAVRDLGAAWSNHFASRRGMRKGPKIERPVFKSRKENRHAIRFTANARFRITEEGKLRLPGVGEVRVKWTRSLPSVPSSVTVIKDPSGRYFCSFVVETDPAADLMEPTTGDVGIDLGLNRFAVLSDGTHIASPKYLRRAEKKLRKRQRELSRKQKGSKNRDKARIKVARAHAEVADSRRNFHHQWSHKLTGENQAVFAETLNVRGLARGRLAKSVHDAGWAQFVSFVEYKSARRGRTFVKVGRTFPSSRVCSGCGHHDGPKPLCIRSWTCPSCGIRHDRDWNAAKNVRYEGCRMAAKRPPTPGPGAPESKHSG